MKLEDLMLVGFLVLYALCMSDAQANEPETNDMRYMTEAIYFESRGEPDICKLFVAKTIKTRIAKNFWKDTVEEVVHQVSKKGTCQFSYYCDGKPETMDYESEAYKHSYEIANWALYREDLPDSMFGFPDHFINHALSDKDWYEGMERVVVCGGHSFYRSDIK
ncbi:hypothetical protein VPDG_00048 [Vibrio phage henriette 12B8]|uniref:endolysin n=1 Tax=Vibrio phage henriette 12B8 TaxID=573174 RepID=UPI0002C0BF6F|nr:endolysin [Vibrio phage henriette 12B8]AGG58209.1 hypothetical protein VPDG_00048 [Vibrio phage henriette 12B8]